MQKQRRVVPRAFQLRCCDATVVAMGLVVALGAIFRQEITFFLIGQ